MRSPRPARRFSWRIAVDEMIERLHGRGWSGRLMFRLGLQPSLRVREIEHRCACEAVSDDPLRIVFGSDFHAGPVTDPRHLARACAQLADAEPDVLLLGGDFVSADARYVDELAVMLGQVPAPFGRFAVLGNHDIRVDERYLVGRLEEAGVCVLVNESVPLPAPWSDVWICGLDDPTGGQPDGPRTMRGAEGARVLLMHSPDGLDAIGDERFDVALCGHTHGGQIALPGGRPLVLPRGRLNRKYPAGLFRVGADDGSVLFVSRGVGNACSLPLRWNADPDIVICNLHAVATPAQTPARPAVATAGD